MSETKETPAPGAADKIAQAIAASAPANEPQDKTLSEKEKLEKLAQLAPPPPAQPGAAPEKNKGGRPLGSKTKPKPPQQKAAPAAAAQPAPLPMMEPEKLRLLSGAVLGMLTARLPNPIPASAGEIDLFNSALTDVVNEYMPAVSQYGSLLTLGSVLALVVIPRISAPAPQQKPEKETPGA